MKRKTNEVQIEVNLSEEQEISTGDRILDHLLSTLCFYMKKSIRINASGDIPHHLWEDVGLVLGRELRENIEVENIARFGTSITPMDDALVLVAVDISRPFLAFNLSVKEKEGGFRTSLFREFLSGLTRSLGVTIHVKAMDGTNAHHLIEASCKSLGSAFAVAFSRGDRVESTKGKLQ